MRRRRYPWREVAAKARAAGGAWTLHASLAAVDHHLLQHARRRVRALRPTAAGRYEFARGAEANDELGRRIFDLWVRFVPLDHQGD